MEWGSIIYLYTPCGEIRCSYCRRRVLPPNYNPESIGPLLGHALYIVGRGVCDKLEINKFVKSIIIPLSLFIIKKTVC